MIKTKSSRYIGSSLVTSENIFMLVYFFCMQRSSYNKEMWIFFATLCFAAGLRLAQNLA